MANSTIAFWTEMTRVQAINALDKVMLGINSTGEAQYTNFADLKNAIGAISGAGFYPPVQPGGTLGNPSTISFTFLAPGSYNGGSLVVTDNKLGLGYWNGSSWSLTTIPLPQLAVVDNLTSTNITSALSANQGRVLNDSKEPSINKKTTINSSDTEFPTSKAVLNYGQTLVVAKENSTNKKTTVNQSDTEFPTSFAVIKYVNTVVREYEKLTNKKDVINVFDNPNYYPTNIAVTKYVDGKIKDFSNVKFGGTIDEEKDLSKPTEKIWYFARRGTYNTNPSITIDSELAILSYDGKIWTYADLNIEVQKDFIVFNTIAELRDISQVQIEYLRTGIIKGVIVNGYYKANDTPASISYYVSDTTESDDGGSVITIGDLKLEHNFEIIDPLYYGAKGDGVADDSVFIERVLRTGIPIKNSNNTFAIKSLISSTSIKIDIRGLKLKLIAGSLGTGSNIRFNETAIKTGYVNNGTTIAELSKTITLDNVSNVQVGDMIVLKCQAQTSGNIVSGKTYVIKATGGNFASVGAPNNNLNTEFTATGSVPDYGTEGSLLPLWDFEPRAGITDVTYGEVNKVLSIAGNVITLDMPLTGQYSATYKLGYTIYRPAPLSIDGLKVYADSPGLFGCLGIANKIEPTIINTDLEKVSGSAGISVSQCYKALIGMSSANNGYYADTTTSYGFQDNGSVASTYISNNFANNRRAIDFSGDIPSKLGKAVNNIVISTPSTNNSGSCLGSHGGADLTTYENNQLIGGIIGIQHRGGRATAIGNTFVGHTISCITISYSNNFTAKGNVLGASKDYASTNTSYFIQTNDTTSFSKNKPLVIEGNNISELRTAVIGFTSATPVTLEGLQVRNNNFTLRSNSSANKVGFIVNTAAGLVTVNRSLFFNNTINTINGDYSFAHGSILNNIYNYGDIGREITAADVSSWSGAGTLSVNSINVTQKSIDNKTANVSGTMTFTVTGGLVRPRISNLLRATGDIDSQYQEGGVIRVNLAGEIYLGYAVGDAYNTPFPIGTHSVNFNINYPINTNFTY